MTGEAIRVCSITHRYGITIALRSIDLVVAQGEFITFLGPSGCGKTTLLRIMAGFVRPTEGSVWIQGIDVTAVPPHRRPLNMVFQRPALFPHLSVGQNIAFSLELAGTPKDEIAQRVRESLRLVRLPGYEDRRSHELSGGQTQRVALARVLVGKPKVLLLDEPLSALDLAIRLEMEAELRRVHRETGAAFVYVTHDQREALALSDRVAVFNGGCIEQLGSPSDIYRDPRTQFVARFVGDANVLPAIVHSRQGGSASIEINGVQFTVRASGTARNGPAKLILRQESVRLNAFNARDGAGLRGTVRDFAYRGAGHAYHIEIPGLPELLKAEVPAEAVPLGVGRPVVVSFEGPVCLIDEGEDQ